MKRPILAVTFLLIFLGTCFADSGPPVYEVEKIRLDKIHVDQQEILSQQEITEVVRSYLGREVSYEDLEQIRHELTRLIIDKGYINSGVVLPDQDVSAGMVSFRVVPGGLTRIDVSGNEGFSSSWLESKLRRGTDGPLNLLDLQKNLQLLQSDRSVRRINAELKAGDEPGESVLVATVSEQPPFSAGLILSNNGSPSTGSYRGDLSLAYTNLIGRGDRLEATLGLAEGDVNYSLRATLPLNRYDTTFAAYYSKGDSTVIENAFKHLDIESDSRTFGVKIAHPFYLSLNSQLTFAVAGEQREDQTSLLGTGFSFSPGVVEGEARVTVIRASQEYIDRSTNYLFALASSFHFGIDAMDATLHDDDTADGEFFAWLGQLRYVRQLTKAQMLFRVDGQWSDDRLLPMEKFSIGGLSSVRGYRKDFLVRDSGVSGSLEARLPITGHLDATGITFIPFYDFGYARNVDIDGEDGEFIHSIGAGLRWIPWSTLSLECFYGYAFKEADIFDDSDPQDHGIHFALSWETP